MAGGTANPDLKPLSQNHKFKKPKKPSSKEGENTDGTRSSLAELLCIVSASSSDSDSEGKQRGETIKVPTGKTAIVLIGGLQLLSGGSTTATRYLPMCEK